MKFNKELLTQKHIRLGLIKINEIILLNIILSIVVQILLIISLWHLNSNLGIIWFLWWIIGGFAYIKIPSKRKFINKVYKLPINISVLFSAYLIEIGYWLYIKIFTKGKK